MIAPNSKGARRRGIRIMQVQEQRYANVIVLQPVANRATSIIANSFFITSTPC